MSDTSQGPGWWQASDGKWYRPEQHPDYVPPAVEPDATIQMPTPVSAGPTRGAGGYTGPKRSIGTDLGVLWRERRGLRIAAVALGVVAVLAVATTIAGGGKGKPTRVQTGVTTTTLSTSTSRLAVAATTTSAPTSTSITTTTVPTTTTTIARTTLPSTTVAPATTAPATTAPHAIVTPGAFCTPQGASGYTSAGTYMTCTTTATDSRGRWRAA